MVGESVNESSGSRRSAAKGSSSRASSSACARLELLAGNRLDQRRGLSLQPQLRLVGGQPLDQRGRFDERVVRDPGHRGMPGAAVDAHPERRAHLLGGRAEVERAARELDPLAAALVEAVVGADGVGVLLAEPGQAEVVADLLVGGRDEDQVAARLEPLAGQRRDRDSAGRDLALHVERAATPDLAVAQLARPRIDLPLARVRDDRVRMREQQEARPVSAPGNARDEVRPLRDLRVQLALDAVLGEVVAQQLGRLRLVPRRVDRVEPDQLLQELRDLVAETFGLRRWRCHQRGGSNRKMR